MNIAKMQQQSLAEGKCAEIKDDDEESLDQLLGPLSDVESDDSKDGDYVLSQFTSCFLFF